MFDLESLYEEGKIKDITQLFIENAPNYFSLFSREELETVSYKGKILAVPSYSLPETKRLQAIIRKDVPEELKISSIGSFSEFELLDKVRKNKPELVPTVITPFKPAPTSVDLPGPSVLDIFAEAAGYTILSSGDLEIVYRTDDPDIKLLDWKQTPEYKKGVETFMNWRRKGYADVSMNKRKWSEYASIISYKGDSEKISNLVMEETGKPAEFVEFELYPDLITTRTFDPGNIVVFSSKSEKTEKALAFVDWLMTDREAYNLFVYGIQGKDYTLDEKNHVKLLIPEGYTENDIYFNIHKSWSLVNNKLDIQDEELFREKSRYVESKSRYMPHLAFRIDINSILRSYSNFSSADRRRFERSYVAGNKTLEELDEFLKEQKKITDPILQEIQKRLDEWRTVNKNLN